MRSICKFSIQARTRRDSADFLNSKISFSRTVNKFTRSLRGQFSKQSETNFGLNIFRPEAGKIVQIFGDTHIFKALSGVVYFDFAPDEA